MYKVIENKQIKKDIYEITIEAPNVIKEYKIGEFAIIMANENSERIPLSIYDYDIYKGYVSFIYKLVGASTLELSKIDKNIYSISGPYGNPSTILKDYKKYKKVLFVVNGITIANAYKEIEFLHEKNINISIIYAYNRKNDVILEEKIKPLVDKLQIIDTERLFEYLKNDKKKYDMVLAFGNMEILKTVTEIEKKLGNPILVNMHTIMVDGLGLCGSCRIYDNGVLKLSCQDGPEFRGENIDFNSSIKRNKMYKEEELNNFNKVKKGLTNE